MCQMCVAGYLLDTSLLSTSLASWQARHGRRATLLAAAFSGLAALAPRPADAEVDVLGSYKLVDILKDAKELGTLYEPTQMRTVICKETRSSCSRTPCNL